ncbi:MAG: flavin reductase family protein, partial [Verrucomicrobiota bacterium]
MEIDLTGPLREEAYLILSGLVTPRPIALTTTVDLEGRVNAAPFSFFNVLGDSPPIVGLCPGDRSPGIPKDTARNIRLTHEFVINLIDEPLGLQMNHCAATLPPGENELLHSGLTPIASSVVKPPRIAEAPVALECRSHSIIEI